MPSFSRVGKGQGTVPGTDFQDASESGQLAVLEGGNAAAEAIFGRATEPLVAAILRYGAGSVGTFAGMPGHAMSAGSQISGVNLLVANIRTALDRRTQSVGSQRVAEPPIQAEARPFGSITGFWDAALQEELRESEPVSVEGQLSKYAPMLVGYPQVKREMHLRYRTELEKKDAQTSPAESAYLSYTAGQMVWRLDLGDNFPWQYLGLYHSIVRNSIPVYVEKEYFEKTVSRVFAASKSSTVVEARIEGKLGELPVEFTKRFIKEANLGRFSPRIEQAARAPIFGIFVDGEDTRIEYAGNPRYLDGDIWVAVENSEGEQRIVTRFLDLADPEDLGRECEELHNEVNKLKELDSGSRVIFQFDEVGRPVPG